jgi:hypothetical protein
MSLGETVEAQTVVSSDNNHHIGQLQNIEE